MWANFSGVDILATHSSLKRYRRKIRRRLLTSRRSWVTAEILVVTVTVKPR